MATDEGSPEVVIFERLAKLLLPPDGTGTVVQTDERWSLSDRLGEVDGPVVWGRPPLSSGAGARLATRFAGDRRKALARLRRRPPAGLRVVDSLWWVPPEIRPSRFKQPLKNALAAGALLSLSSEGRFDRALDAAWRDAGLEEPMQGARPSSGGSLRVDLGEERIFRAGAAESPADPGPGAEAIELLTQSGLDLVPRLVARGEAAGVGWSIESRLEGRRPLALTDELVRDVVSVCARFPSAASSPRTFDEATEVVADEVPSARKRLDTLVRPHREIVGELPAVLRHGDLWAGNLLEKDGSLTGIVDWDAAHPAGVPGEDLVHLLAAGEHPSSLGDRFLKRPWRSERFATASGPYWDALGIDPRPEVLDAVGVAWWVAQIASNLTRLPHLASDPGWLRSNVDAVLRSV